MVVELDGSHVRTGKKVMQEGVSLTLKRGLPKSQRPPDWREVRVGFARPLGAQKDKRTFVAQMSQYPELVWRLEIAAFMQGMSTRTDAPKNPENCTLELYITSSLIDLGASLW